MSESAVRYRLYGLQSGDVTVVSGWKGLIANRNEAWASAFEKAVASIREAQRAEVSPWTLPS